MTKSNDAEVRYIDAAGCPDWCDLDHADLARQAAAGAADAPEPGHHSAQLLYTQDSSVELETGADGANLQVEADTLTADQAEALAHALLRGVALLRTAA